MKRLVLFSALLVIAAGCSPPAGSLVPQKSSSLASSSLSVELQISPATESITTGSSIQLSATGGQSPYTFSDISGGCTQSRLTHGLFTAPTTSGSCMIAVTDAAKNTATATISVYSPGSTNPGTTPTTPSTTSVVGSFSPSTVTLGTQVTLSATGGTAPYTYSIVSGGGSISGNMYAASSTGAVVLKVTDAAGLTTTISFQVNAAGTTNTNATFALGALNLTPGKTVALDSVNLQFQTDGNFVVYANSGGTAVWAANVQNAACATSAGNCTASFQADGNLVLSSGGTAYWASSTSTQVGWTSYQLVFQDKAPYLVITDMSGNDLWDSTTENN